VTSLTIVSVYPEVLGTYGDSGNVRVLERRLAWRGISSTVLDVPLGAALPLQADLYVLGGSEDEIQHRALLALRESGLQSAVGNGAHVFAVCAGLQLLGNSMRRGDGSQVEGLGLLDAVTERLGRRVVGEVEARFVDAALPTLTGFANHGAGTELGPRARPLAVTTSGLGNGGQPRGPEGVVQGSVVATYLHGPVLARNPAFADWLLGRVVGRELRPLPSGPPEALHAALVGNR
jgi:CobQ-like glutamine amidotransferase family enzyme